METPLAHRCEVQWRGQSGIVLPVVLIMIVLMTVVVLFQSRRGVLDERLASNVRGIVTMDTAAQYALRWCELWLWVSPPGVVPGTGRPNPPRTMAAPLQTDPPAWRTNANWTNFAVSLPAGAFGPNANITQARCLIEDAVAELEIVRDSSLDGGNVLEFVDTWRKYRITSEVDGPGAEGLRFARAQSEVRMNVN